MKISGINSEKCRNCGICAQECPTGLYFKNNENKMDYSDPNKWCIECGHCTASCPYDAIDFISDDKPIQFDGKDLINYNEFTKFLLTKRSIRNYIDKEIPDEEIKKFLDAMRYSPSGHNFQPCEYLIIRNRKIIKMLADETIQSLRSFRMLMKMHRFLKIFLPENFYKVLSDKSTALGIDDMIRQYKAGKDVIFFNAPAVILVHVPDMGGLSYVDPSISLTYGMLSLHAQGIASCWMGFAMMTLGKNKKILKALNIPKGRLIAGAITIGYPVNKYYSVPVRNKIKAEWMN